MQNAQSDDDFALSFGYHENATEYMNNNRSMMDPKMIRQTKLDQARILEQFNTPYYSLLEFGAESMLSLEHLGKMFMEIVSGTFIKEKWQKFMMTLKDSTATENESDTVTVTKVDLIQKQLDMLVAQMEKVKEESRRKSEELELLRRQMQQSDSFSQQSGGVSPSNVYNQSINVSATEQNYRGYSTNYNNPSDDYIMDFSKPATYQPVSNQAHVSTQPDETPLVVRRRSLQPDIMSQNTENKPPAIPSVPPRRMQSRESSRHTPPPPPPPKAPIINNERKDLRDDVVAQHSLLLEEIRRSRQDGKIKMPQSEIHNNKQNQRDIIVNGTDDEPAVTKEQRQLKLSLNDEIKMKMRERLQVMNESDTEDETPVNEMD